MSKDLYMKFLQEGVAPRPDYSFETPNQEFQNVAKEFVRNRPLDYVMPRFSVKTKAYREKLVKIIRSAPNMYAVVLPTTNKNIWLETMVLIKKLYMWDQYLQHKNLPPFMPLRDIVCRNLLEGPAFADLVKDIWAYSLRYVTGINFETPKGVPIFLFEDVNQIYPPEHLINFLREEDLSDLLDWSFEPPSKIKTKYIEKLYTYVMEGIRENQVLRYLDELDSLTLGNQTKSADPLLGKMQSFKLRKLKGFPNEINDHLYFEISSVHKTPCESRTIAISDVPTRNLLSIVRENLSNLFTNKYDYYGSTRSWSVRNRIGYNEDKIKIMFDQRKAGWSFPHELVALTFKALCDKYPLFEPFQIMYNIFSEGKIIYRIKEQDMKPLKGFILGMHDNICSYIMSCIFQVYLEDIPEDEKVAFDAAFFGDDSVIIIDTSILPRYYNFYWNKWLRLCSKYGIALNLKKSYISNVGVFCEMYGFGSKQTLYRHSKMFLNVLNSLLCYNITHGKYYWCAISDQINRYLSYLSGVDKDSVEKTIGKWFPITRLHLGFEFDGDEISLPFECGGWEYLRDGYDYSLFLEMTRKQEIPLPYLEIAKQSTIYKRQFKKNKKFRTELLQDRWISEMLEFLDLPVNGSNIKDNLTECIKLFDYGPGQGLQREFWRDFYIARQKAYHTKKFKYGKPHYFEYFMEGRIANQALTPEMLVRDVNLENVFVLERLLPVKTQNINHHPLRAYDLFLQKMHENAPLNCKYTKDFSIEYLLRSIFKHIRNIPYFIPVEWFIWCERQGIELSTLYSDMMSKYGINIFQYQIPIKKIKSSFLEKFGLLVFKGDLIIWCEKINLPRLISYTDMINISYAYDNDKVICDIINLDLADMYEIHQASKEGYNPNKKVIIMEDESAMIDEMLASMLKKHETDDEPKEEETSSLSEMNLQLNFNMEDLIDGGGDEYPSSSDDEIRSYESDQNEFMDMYHDILNDDEDLPSGDSSSEG